MTHAALLIECPGCDQDVVAEVHMDAPLYVIHPPAVDGSIEVDTVTVMHTEIRGHNCPNTQAA